MIPVDSCGGSSVRRVGVALYHHPATVKPASGQIISIEIVIKPVEMEAVLEIWVTEITVDLYFLDECQIALGPVCKLCLGNAEGLALHIKIEGRQAFERVAQQGEYDARLGDEVQIAPINMAADDLVARKFFLGIGGKFALML